MDQKPLTADDYRQRIRAIPTDLDADALANELRPVFSDLELRNVPPLVIDKILEDAAGHLKVKKSLLSKQFTAVQKSLKKQLAQVDPAVEKADLFTKSWIVWATATYAEKGEKPQFYIAVDQPFPRWVEHSEQKILVMAGLDIEADRAFNSQFLYALSLRAQVQGPATDAGGIHSALMNLRNGVYDCNTGTLSSWRPEMKLLGALPRAYLPPQDPRRLPAHKNRVHRFLKKYGKAVYHRLVHWVFPRVCIPAPGGGLIFLIGIPGCGKTTVMEEVGSRLVGPPARLTLDQVEKCGHELEQWIETYWNFFDEMPANGLKGCEILKLIATMRMLTVNPKYRRPMTLRNTTTPVFGANQMPWIPDADGAIFDRLIILYFTHRFRNTEREIPDLGRYLDEIPQEHWDSFFSDVLDIARDNTTVKPPRGAMEQQYKLLRDRLFIFMTSTIRDAPGQVMRVGDLVKLYQEERARISRAAERNHKTVEPETRGAGSLFDAALQYSRFLDLDLFQDSHDKCWCLRGVAFQTEGQSAAMTTPVPVVFPQHVGIAGDWTRATLSARAGQPKPLNCQEKFRALRITPALFSLSRRGEKKMKNRKKFLSVSRKDSAKSAAVVRRDVENSKDDNDYLGQWTADGGAELRIQLAPGVGRKGTWPTRLTDVAAARRVLGHVRTCITDLDRFQTELLGRVDREGSVHVRQIGMMLRPGLHPFLVPLIHHLNQRGLLRWEPPFLTRRKEHVDNIN